MGVWSLDDGGDGRIRRRRRLVSLVWLGLEVDGKRKKMKMKEMMMSSGLRGDIWVGWL